jgi:hypothetical protein
MMDGRRMLIVGDRFMINGQLWLLIVCDQFMIDGRLLLLIVGIVGRLLIVGRMLIVSRQFMMDGGC